MDLGATDSRVLIVAGYSEVPFKVGLRGANVGSVLFVCHSRIPLAIKVGICVCKAPHNQVHLSRSENISIK